MKLVTIFIVLLVLSFQENSTIPVINPNRAIDFIAFTPKEKFKIIQHAIEKVYFIVLFGYFFVFTTHVSAKGVIKFQNEYAGSVQLEIQNVGKGDLIFLNNSD